MSILDENYKFHHLPLTPAIAEYLIIQYLSGQQLKRGEIINIVEKIHLQNGGIPCQSANVSATIKRALRNLKEKGSITNPSTGWWKITESHLENINQESLSLDLLEEESIENDVEIIPFLTLGKGEESIYVYYYPAYKNIAVNNGQSRWPCKIGRTSNNIRVRIKEQVTGMPEKPEIGLVYLTDDSRTLEVVIHGILSLRGQWSEDSPGIEWFMTSPNNILEIIKYILQEPR